LVQFLRRVRFRARSGPRDKDQASSAYQGGDRGEDEYR
jgi:hypothetical protein